jgi:serine/threonine protein kinase/tetratricopeptide (TPR) repeat protein/polyhydroxyalkanoate synthesis regulator phasin
MELLRGKSLRTFLHTDGLPVDPIRAIFWIRQAAKGLAAAHRQGLIHRDIKPSNLWIQEAEGSDDERIKVLDFGLVKSASMNEGMSETGEVVGTPVYMSPEQILGTERVTAASDVYALGVILFELLVGHPPYQGDDRMEIFKGHVLGPIPRPATDITGRPIQNVLREIWAQALAKEAAQRFSDADGFLNALSRVGNIESQIPSNIQTKPIRKGVISRLPTVDMTSDVDTLENLAATQLRLSSLSRDLRERHRVTVLSAEVIDSPHALALDFEERLDRLEPLLDAWVARLESLNVTPERIEGVGIRAIFGLPTASEDDAERALRGALSLRREYRQQSLGDGFSLRIGLDTDALLSAPDPLSATGHRVLGQPYRVAETVARGANDQDGFPVLSETAYRTLQRVITVPPEPVTLENGDKVYPVRANEDLTSEHITINHDQDVTRSLLGRTEELKTIEHHIVESINQRQPSRLLLTGEPGYGKSRLLVALTRRLRVIIPDVRILKAGPDDASSTAYGVVRNLLIGASRESTDSSSKDSITRWAATLIPGLDSKRLADLLSLVGLSEKLDSSSQSAQLARHRALGILTDLCGAMAANGGLIILLDDWDQADSDSAELLRGVVTELAGFPIAVVAAARAVEQLSDQYDSVVELGPLADSDARALVNRLLRKGEYSSREIERIVDRANGNPLFLEELARSVERNFTDSADGVLPETLHALLRARYDGQPSESRALLQYASIVGRVFWSGAVNVQLPTPLEELDDVLTGLAHEGLIERTWANTYPHDAEWRFVQPMMRDVAYQSTLKRERRRGHGAVASWLQAQGDGLLPAHLPLLAMHLEEAQKIPAAADAWLKAADTARDRYVNTDAQKAYTKALNLQTSWQRADILRAHLELGIVAFLAGDIETAEANLCEVTTATDSPPDERTRALIQRARIAGVTARSADERGLLEDAMRASDHASLWIRLQAVVQYSWLLSRSTKRGETHDAQMSPESIRALIDKLLDEAPDKNDDPACLIPLGNLYLVAAISDRLRGDLNAAEKDLLLGLKTFRRARSVHGEATTLATLGNTLWALRRYGEAAAALRKGARLFDAGGFSLHFVMTELGLARTLLSQDHPFEARRLLERIRQAHPSLPLHHRVLLNLNDGLAAKALGQQEVAIGLAQRCLQDARDGDSDEVLGWALDAAGRILEDEPLLAEACDVWRQLQRPVELLAALEGLSELNDGDVSNDLSREISRLQDLLFDAKSPNS